MKTIFFLEAIYSLAAYIQKRKPTGTYSQTQGRKSSGTYS